MAYEDILDCVRNRSAPGILILSLEGELLYSNAEASSFFKRPGCIPADVRRLCGAIKAKTRFDDETDLCSAACGLFSGKGEVLYSLRAFLIGHEETDFPPRVLALIEKVVERHAINVKKATTKFHLSKREIQIVKDVAQGLSNKDVACKRFISEYTVKDHLKSIMRKMNVTSRSELIVSLR